MHGRITPGNDFPLLVFEATAPPDDVTDFNSYVLQPEPFKGFFLFVKLNIVGFHLVVAACKSLSDYGLKHIGGTHNGTSGCAYL